MLHPLQITVLQGVFHFLAVEKPVDNVENFPTENGKTVKNITIMSTDIPSCTRFLSVIIC